MSDRDWRTPTAFVVFGALALTAFWFAAWDTATVLTEQRVRNEQATQAYTEQTIQRIQNECGSDLDTLAVRSCLSEIIQADNDNSRAERDLNAQEVMARFTRIMGWVGVLGIFVGCGSIYLIWQTLRETQSMANDTREIGEAQVRAYIAASKAWITYDGQSSCLTFSCSTVNYGQSPAIDGFALAKITLFVNNRIINFRVIHEIGTIPVGEAVGISTNYLHCKVSAGDFHNAVACHVQLKVIARDVFKRRITSSNFFTAGGSPDPTRGYEMDTSTDILAGMGHDIKESDFADIWPNWRKQNEHKQ